MCNVYMNTYIIIVSIGYSVVTRGLYRLYLLYNQESRLFCCSYKNLYIVTKSLYTDRGVTFTLKTIARCDCHRV